MKIFLDNKLTLVDATSKQEVDIVRMLTFDNPEYILLKQARKPTWSIDKTISLYSKEQSNIIAPVGFLPVLKWYLEQTNTRYEIIDMLPHTIKADFGEWNKDVILRDYQEEAVRKVNEDNGLIVSGAGSGKTLMGFRYLYEKGVPAIWITHTLDLVNQAMIRARTYIPDIGEIGMIGDGKAFYGDGKLIVATFQSLGRNPEIIQQLNGFIDTVVVDEAHHAASPFFEDTLSQFRCRNMIGLTATPQRKDQLEFIVYNALGPIQIQVDRTAQYEEKKLIKPEVKFVYTSSNMENISYTTAGVDAGGEDINYVELTRLLYNHDERFELVANNICDTYNAEQYVLVVGESIPYLHKLKSRVAELLKVDANLEIVHSTLAKTKWITAKSRRHAEIAVESGEALDSKFDKKARRFKIKVPAYTEEEFKRWQITKKEREAIMNRSYDKKVDILFATQLAREGLDLPHLTIGHSVSPKRGDVGSRADGSAVEQEMGRIMRPDPDNPNKLPIWFDYVDFDIPIFRSQYYSRRKTYKRLQIDLPKKKKSKEDDLFEQLRKNNLI